MIVVCFGTSIKKVNQNHLSQPWSNKVNQLRPSLQMVCSFGLLVLYIHKKVFRECYLRLKAFIRTSWWHFGRGDRSPRVDGLGVGYVCQFWGVSCLHYFTIVFHIHIHGVKIKTFYLITFLRNKIYFMGNLSSG